MKKQFWLFAALVGSLLLFFVFGNPRKVPTDEVRDRQTAAAAAQQASNGDSSAFFRLFSPELKTELPEKQLAERWKKTRRAVGPFWKMGKTESTLLDDGNKQVTTDVCYEKGTVRLEMVFLPSGKLTSFFFSNDDSRESPLPYCLAESEAVIGRGTNRELPGTLTRRKEGASDTVALLVHGSGPNNRDETIFANRPFRDLARGLAAEGIDVLRYDKRTNLYPIEFVAADDLHQTVWEETIEDAILAAKMLREEFGYRHVWLIGHSLGGALAPRIANESGGLFDGLVIMAGTPRLLFDVLVEQITRITSKYGFLKRQAAEHYIAGERQKWSAILTEPDSQTVGKKLFKQPAFYFKELARHDTAAEVQKFTGPILVLHGTEDSQLSVDQDFAPWKKILSENPEAKFILYDHLNHLFVPVAAQAPNLLDQYKTPGHVAPKVIKDIAAFIHESRTKQ